jgi:hypothetical protein
MEKEETKKTGNQEGEGAAKRTDSFFELCGSCCGKAGMSAEMMKMCEGMGSSAEMMKMFQGMGKNWKDMPTPSNLRKMCKETCQAGAK